MSPEVFAVITLGSYTIFFWQTHTNPITAISKYTKSWPKSSCIKFIEIKPECILFCFSIHLQFIFLCYTKCNLVHFYIWTTGYHFFHFSNPKSILYITMEAWKIGCMLYYCQPQKKTRWNCHILLIIPENSSSDLNCHILLIIPENSSSYLNCHILLVIPENSSSYLNCHILLIISENSSSNLNCHILLIISENSSSDLNCHILLIIPEN